jgi:hypothetical protein
MPKNLLPPSFSAPFPIPQPQQQNNKLIKNHQQQPSKYGRASNDGAEYIDISEYEKFFAVLQEAAGE